MKWLPVGMSALCGVLCWGSAITPAAPVNILTGNSDKARTGLNPNETILTPANVSSNSFGRIFSQPVDGPVYAQPLYVSNLPIPSKGTHNVVFIATQHDSVYAFDADSNSGSNAAPLWHKSFINPAAGVTAASTLDAVDFSWQDCRTFVGEIGIVGTPVIDGPSGTMYVVARTKEPATNGGGFVQVQRLHALDITTGNERSNSPVVIQAMVPGTGAGSSNGMVAFNAAREIQRPGLLLTGGVVYIAWCSYCDLDPYHGWVIGYHAQSLQQVGVFNVSPNAARGGIWMGGAGLAAEHDGSIYCITGNGTFDTGVNPKSFGDSFLKLTQGASLTLTDYFTPYNQATMDAADEDLGSGGAMVLPDSVGSVAHPHLLTGCSKLGKIYLLDRDNMGHFNAANNNQIVQELTLFASQQGTPHFFGMPAFFNNRLYVQGVGEPLKSYSFTNGLLNSIPHSQTSEAITYRGATPSITADGTNNGILWLISPTPALRAYNAENLSQKLYDSYQNSQAGFPDQHSYQKFTVPTIANGKVYLASDNLAVFGLRGIIRSITRNAASVNLSFIGPPGTIVQMSANLVNWTDLGAGTSAGPGLFTYTDTLPAGTLTRFYKLR